MFEKFTSKGIKVLFLAQEEARRGGHKFVGTHHIFLGLISEGSGIAANVLKLSGINLKNSRIEVEKIIGRAGHRFFSDETIPFSPRAKKILELSAKQAQQYGHNYICTEHVLLGLINGEEGVAISVLENLKIDINYIAKETIKRTSKENSKVYLNSFEEYINDDSESFEGDNDDDLLKKLLAIGISNSLQLNENDIFYWWQKKYIDTQKNNNKNSNEVLININTAKEELEKVDKETLINILNQKKKSNISNINSNEIKTKDNKPINNLNNNSAKKYKELGDEKYDFKKFREAIAFYNLALDLDPLNSNLFHSRGAALDSLGNYNDAIKDYDKAIILNSNNPDFFNSRGVTKGNLNFYTEAIKDLDKALKFDPTNDLYIKNKKEIIRLQDQENLGDNEKKSATFWKIEGDLLKEEKKDFLGAIQYYSKAIEIDNTYHDAFIERGLCYLKINKLTKSSKDFLSAINLEPNNIDGYYLRGIILEKQFLFDLANDEFSKILDLNPISNRNFLFKGLVFLKMNMNGNAIENFTKLIDLEQDNKDAYFFRGNAKFNSKDFKGAIRDYTNTISIDQDYHEALFKRGLAKYKLKEYEDAYNDFLKGYELDPDNNDLSLKKEFERIKEIINSPNSFADDNKEVNKLKIKIKRFHKYLRKYPIKTPMGFLNFFALPYNIILSLVLLSFSYFIFSIVLFISLYIFLIYVYE